MSPQTSPHRDDDDDDGDGDNSRDAITGDDCYGGGLIARADRGWV